MIVNILDYDTGKVHIIELPKDIKENNTVENYLSKVLNFNLKNIYYMLTDNINLRLRTL